MPKVVQYCHVIRGIFHDMFAHLTANVCVVVQVSSDLVCDCGKVCDNAANLRQHKDVCGKGYTCKKCGKISDSKNSHKKHQKACNQ